MVKVCTECKKEYNSAASQRKNRNGRCRPCINKTVRAKYAKKMSAIGREVNRYNNLISAGLKECKGCNQVKAVDSFARRSKTKSDLRSKCRSCVSIYRKRYESENKETINLNRRKRRKDPIRGIIFTQRDRQRSLFKGGKYKKYKPSTFILREWLGCTVEECMFYLEGKFKEGMTWQNRGIGTGFWQIDHIIPVSLTELNEHGVMVDSEFNRKIWHYTNLQPLWHTENSVKSNTYDPSQNLRVA